MREATNDTRRRGLNAIAILPEKCNDPILFLAFINSPSRKNRTTDVRISEFQGKASFSRKETALRQVTSRVGRISSKSVCCWDEFMAGGTCWNCNLIPFTVLVGSLSRWRGTRDPCPAALPGTPEALRIAHERITVVGAGEIKNLPS